MNREAQIKEWLRSDAERMDALECALSLNLNDWCLAAGFVRNLVWDKLHGVEPPTPLNDIDLIYFDTGDVSDQTDLGYETYLKSISKYPWSVKNQARMHLRNKDAPYLSTSDAMSYWVEVETAVGVRISPNKDLEIIAPFGVESLFGNTVTINCKRRKPEDFAARIKGKKWLERWPNLRVNA